MKTWLKSPDVFFLYTLYQKGGGGGGGAAGWRDYDTGVGDFFLGPTFDLEKFPTSGVKGRVLLEATPHVGHLFLQLRSSTLESHKATTRTALLNR